MARQSSEVLESLEEEVRCPLCMDTFAEPKKLSCDHIICCKCLQELIWRSTGGILTCPECRTATKLQVTDANQFPTAHQVNRFIGIYKKMLAKNPLAATTTGPEVQTDLPMCSFHKSQALALYCKSCEKTICRDCALTSCASKKHDYGFLKDLAQKFKGLIDDKIKPIRMLQQHILEALEAIKQDDEKLERLKKAEIKEIDEEFDAFVNRLKLEKLRVHSKIEEKFNQQAFNNFSKTKVLTNTLDELESCVRTTESLILEENFIANIGRIKKIERELQTLHHQCMALNLKPIQSPGLHSKVKFVPKDIRKFFLLEKNSYTCRFDEFCMLRSLKLKKPVQIDFMIPAELYETKLQSTYICLQDHTYTPVSITKMPLNLVRLSFTPQKRGRHELTIHAKKSAIPSDCIFSSFVHYDPEQVSPLIPVAINNAAGIKCFGNHIYVTSSGTKVTVLQQTKKGFSVSNEISLSGVNDILIWGQHIYFTNISEHLLEKASIDGKKIKVSAGGYGFRPGEFYFPKGIRMSKTNEIYVCDSGNHRIQVFNTELNLLRIIGKPGNGPGQLQGPNDLIFDEDKNIYVVEEQNKRVQVLTPQGEHIRFIGTSGSNRLLHPISISICDSKIYVTDRERQCVSAFSLTGEFVTSFGEKEKLVPECIDIDQDGYIYVTSGRRNVMVY